MIHWRSLLLHQNCNSDEVNKALHHIIKNYLFSWFTAHGAFVPVLLQPCCRLRLALLVKSIRIKWEQLRADNSCSQERVPSVKLWLLWLKHNMPESKVPTGQWARRDVIDRTLSRAAPFAVLWTRPGWHPLWAVSRLQRNQYMHKLAQEGKCRLRKCQGDSRGGVDPTSSETVVDGSHNQQQTRNGCPVSLRLVIQT